MFSLSCAYYKEGFIICTHFRYFSEGWEKLGLYEYYRAKNAVRKQKEDDIKNGLREKSRSPTPIKYDILNVRSPPARRYRYIHIHLLLKLKAPLPLLRVTLKLNILFTGPKVAVQVVSDPSLNLLLPSESRLRREWVAGVASRGAPQRRHLLLHRPASCQYNIIFIHVTHG